jgi:hypothetical protein
MSTISNIKEFKAALDLLSDEQQRVLGARFIAEVLDLTDNKRLKESQAIAQQVQASAEDLLAAYSSAQSIAVDLSFHGVLELINFKKQAEHYVAKACAACLFPMPASVKQRYRAWNVAHYCREARMCANLKHEEDTEILATVEKELQKTIARQYELTSEFLGKA